ncbi:type I-E CRISPR-associated protein Cse1/CasA [Lactiplantibacillus mudanjiangensis]|uniref:Type I-E CRISPR-associated protein Cse1/CasA [Lactobacillus sp.] n=1 Tax=Lactiplantibacillus mudanjiangensis TaxID=1296538 RepID=A0A660DUW8_9LACO|nr:type I-E CRISPR-associated protein Cse1/CasA [Lactiplantibacillus mudanjiangensis]VDG22727.1 type I-E CRISPR-associated protein Cse1/CasA [Lactobacillus sp.] [Lactiplantibacillus mudanjiangensis]VDG26736.1 type I-E CRISPR-associated protein Cse1/CasA [Lactobacillus sp.] [Lactiplantibacillus mudanjiangensis]
MTSKHFNLTTEPWIKVIVAKDNQEETVSLIDLFKHAKDYRQLAGEMRSQDLAILRLLLAILTTVYSRVDGHSNVYEWLENNPDGIFDEDEFDPDDSQDNLQATWQTLSQMGHFTPAVTQYLEKYADRFDFFGDHPFYQVTAADYDALVPENKRVAANKGQVAIKQMNRQVSESGNTPSIFAPKAGHAKNELPLDELIRWVIAYQNFTGVTDKTKIVTDEKFSNSAGWIYRINPVYAKGQSLFETLMLNLILDDSVLHDTDWVPKQQKPVWECPNSRDYVQDRINAVVPDNLAELYTTWSRLLHIEWDKNDEPTIFSAGLPIFDYDGAFIEPMTTWRRDKKTNEYRPAVKGLRSLGIAMWRNFGQYVKVNDTDDVHAPGMVAWLQLLKQKSLIDPEKTLILNSVALISDGNATSQSPAVEVVDDMQLQADVLFDDEKADRWPVRIEDAIGLTQTIGTDYYHFATDLGRIRNLDVRPFASQMSAKFYERLNEPFNDWLAGLKADDDREEKVLAWKRELRGIVLDAANEVMQNSSLRDIKGIDSDHGPLNIFTAKRHLLYNLKVHLELPKE